MSHRTVCSAAVLAALLTGGCKDPASSKAPYVPVGAGALALAPVGGTKPLDDRILAAQKALRQEPKRIDAWLKLSRAFIQKARQESEPAFYAQAKDAADRALELGGPAAPSSIEALQIEGLILLQEHKF